MSDDMPLKIDVKADLTKPVENITDMLKGTHKGLGKIYYALIEPWVNNRKAQADMIAAESARAIKLLEAQTAKDIHDINAGMKEYRHGRLLDIRVTSSADYYSQVKNLNGICDAKRLEAAMFDAAIEINKIPEDEISDEPLNQTFFNHWRAEAELIDDENLRKWWAHLLVEETKKPNSISPRTLQTAKYLSKQEALIFQRIIKGVIGSCLPLQEGGKSPFGNHDDALILQDAGLLGGSGGKVLASPYYLDELGKVTAFPFFEENLVILIQTDEFLLYGKILTTAGSELYHISHQPLSEKDVVDFGKWIYCYTPKFPVRVCRISKYCPELNEDRHYIVSKTPLWISAE